MNRKPIAWRHWLDPCSAFATVLGQFWKSETLDCAMNPALDESFHRSDIPSTPLPVDGMLEIRRIRLARITAIRECKSELDISLTFLNRGTRL